VGAAEITVSRFCLVEGRTQNVTRCHIFPEWYIEVSSKSPKYSRCFHNRQHHFWFKKLNQIHSGDQHFDLADVGRHISVVKWILQR